MTVQLPSVFLDRMQELLGDEFEVFLSSYDDPKHAGIRVNTLKINLDSFLKLSPFALRPIPWCKAGFYVDERVKPGKHPYYHAGLYYIQEPSAMAPAELLNVSEGDRVLDLCAAPGGKSTQIAALLNGTGTLVTNDIHAERTKALAKNIELYGVRNAVVLNESPERIARAFPHYFDKILIDAPCSGEGMFRKDEDMARQWERHSIEKCTVMQRDILNTAAAMLAPGGRIVYSTCTFAPEENEAMIAEFLLGNPDFEVVPVPRDTGISPGRPEWLDWLSGKNGGIKASVPEEIKAQIAGCGRLWPHQVEGEGHFVAVLEQKSEQAGLPAHSAGPELIASERDGRLRDRAAARPSQRSRQAAGADKKGPGERETLDSWRAFAVEHLRAELSGTPLTFGGNVYLSPVAKEQLDGLKVVRPGWYVGTVKNGRFTPGHPLATALAPSEAARTLDLSVDDGEAVRYLKGETLEIEPSRVHTRDGVNPKGYVLVTVDGYSLGWGKWQNGLLKNEYPAGWRWT
ncbi:NOL1/NOP2/sun family putative RNA methylase [Paenibacillus oralis]|uniref:NOL1/NOP2/sun family putative RNA methylase n=1 Tax=Paenibacillus oralis TaxID=2490856 RepID=A0A3P3U5F8_9BACL|nr:RsmF rRNA methyltransferase first C-terminal domain-containing protein [Paenibacillus oralis]RRJ64819.1 NOL1/NOP2/sun family putative RNA methylase [Paenibacillus oralis]